MMHLEQTDQSHETHTGKTKEERAGYRIRRQPEGDGYNPLPDSSRNRALSP